MGHIGSGLITPPDLRTTVGNYNFTDDGGVQAAFTIFTVTGDVILQCHAICDVALTSVGTPTIELGFAGDTNEIIAQIVDATDLVADEIWNDATPTLTTERISEGGLPFRHIVANGQDVIMTLGGADLTAGDIDFYALWRPLSADGLVVAA